MKAKSNKGLVISLLVLCLLIALVPLFALKGAEFGGSDDAGSVMVSEVTGTEYEPWFTPVLETLLGGELPGGGEPDVLSADRAGRRYHRFRDGPSGGAEKMDG